MFFWHIAISIFDHLPQSLVIEDFFEKKFTVNDYNQITRRDFENFNPDELRKDIESPERSLATENNDKNLVFETLLLFTKHLISMLLSEPTLKRLENRSVTQEY